MAKRNTGYARTAMKLRDAFKNMSTVQNIETVNQPEPAEEATVTAVWDPFILVCAEMDAIITITCECGWHDPYMLVGLEMPTEQRGEAHCIYRLFDPSVRKEPV